MVNGILICLIGAALYTDLRTRRIPNVVTVGGCLLGIVWMLIEGKVVISIAGLVLGFSLMLPGFMIGGVGGGDVKLMAAIGSLKGPTFVLNVFIFSTLCGGLLAIISAVRDRRLGRMLIDTWFYLRSLGTSIVTRRNMVSVTLPTADKAAVLPYGVAIFAGTLLVLLGMGWSFI